MARSGQIEDFLPLTPKTFHILLALADHPANGYQIANHVHDHTDGVVKIGPATLYESLHRLESRGLIEETDLRDRPADGRGQRFYRITRRGRAALRADTARLASSLRLARSLGVAEDR